ncbi:DNA replication/repair protein RecF [Lacticaseibacillus yichunensis]|uniref:DNA replication and repair protein RecF n=1 Tax=Lacticaseibacillus yichunensis TaxID=2486015 RepID=A0ABW4CNG5_9LACO|nr:DNA replication/repair protein RecF [Lacticaseibacillus yichunensis]
MRLDHLTLKQYRNYSAVDVDFSPQINVLMGANAQGKTNLLEAMYVLALARSHRTNNDRELIQFGEQFARIAGHVSRETTSNDLELIISTQGKRARIDRIEQPKLSQYLGRFNVVLFAPEDLALVKGSPATRRRFIDMEFGQMSAKYLFALSNYRTMLKQRNAYLKQLKFHQAKDQVYLEVLGDQLAGFGAEIVVARTSLLQQMATFAATIHGGITKGREQLTFSYQSQVPEAARQSVETAQAALQTLFKQHTAREVEQGTTLVGPHRDDVAFIVNDKNVANYGSQGQQRTTALAVKLAEIDLMKAQTGEYPVLLLDDVLSELDDARQTHLLKAIQNKVQTFLTTTSLDGIARELIDAPTVFHVDHGTLSTQ